MMDGKRAGLGQRLQAVWLSRTLKQKIGIFAGSTMLIVVLSLSIDMMLLSYALNGFNTIMEENMLVSSFQEALDTEIKSFENYVRNRTRGSEDHLTEACARTERAVKRLPFDYRRIGRRRYARTWNIRNSYEAYARHREEFLRMEVGGPSYVGRLYKIYEMQEFEKDYVRNLAQMTLEEGNAAYERRVPLFHRLPVILVAAGALQVAVLIYLCRLLYRSLGRPIMLLVEASRQIARNDYFGADLTVENKDEMGELVRAFNKMRHATWGYISTLEEKHEALELLHREELEKLEVERRLEVTKLELLKSQLNPHFLFNTLNMISCMARLEEAGTTEKMITSMGSLFRYNLKNPEPTVFLEQELKIVKDYMYIQQMRFGERVRYQVECLADAGRACIPTFTLQPIVENAVIHGLAGKEQGGCIYIRIWQEDGRLIVSVADTGGGMEEGSLQKLRAALSESATAKVGIGLGNIYQRIHAMYQDGEFAIYSRAGCGTVVRMAFGIEEDGRCTDC